MVTDLVGVLGIDVDDVERPRHRGPRQGRTHEHVVERLAIALEVVAIAFLHRQLADDQVGERTVPIRRGHGDLAHWSCRSR